MGITFKSTRQLANTVDRVVTLLHPEYTIAKKSSTVYRRETI